MEGRLRLLAGRVVNVPAAEALELHRRSGGSPLYLDRLLSARRDHMPGAASIPRDLSLLIEAQLDGLSSLAADGLVAMAALGVVAPLKHLYALVASEAVGEMATAGLLTEDGLHVRFCHSIVREVVLERMRTTERHRRHFETFEQLAMVRPHPSSTTLAHPNGGRTVQGLPLADIGGVLMGCYE